jgi:ribose transport system permease protein
MSADFLKAADAPAKRRADTVIYWLRQSFIHLGILPLLLLAAILFFGLQEERFYSSLNIFNVARQTTFLIIVALGQMVVVLTAGLDMSSGAIVGFTGIVTALVLKAILGAYPDAILLAGLAAVFIGTLAGASIGALNGFGVSVLGVSPFMMTLGTATSLVGVSLFLTNGMPLTGVPDEFMRVLGYGRIMGLAPPVFITIVLLVLVFLLLNRTTSAAIFMPSAPICGRPSSPA